jgi:hypothetical protein
MGHGHGAAWTTGHGPGQRPEASCQQYCVLHVVLPHGPYGPSGVCACGVVYGVWSAGRVAPHSSLLTAAHCSLLTGSALSQQSVWRGVWRVAWLCRVAVAVAVAVCGLSAVSSSQQQPQPVWFRGSLLSAFVSWGARWNPPRSQVPSNVIKRAHPTRLGRPLGP